MRHRVPPAFLLAAGVALGLASCTGLPNDIGVRPHRSVAMQTRSASHYPILAWWNDHAPDRGTRKIVVNLTSQQAFFYRGDVLVGQTNISSGRRDFETPLASIVLLKRTRPMSPASTVPTAPLRV